MYYQGKFKPKNPQKYLGDSDNISYRSSWELTTFMWLDSNPGVVQWASEELVIPYTLDREIIEEHIGPDFKSDGKPHRYYIDLQITFKNGTKLLVEIKPHTQTIPPKPRKRKTRKYLVELLTYVQNQSKWKTASKWASENGWQFEVWTEHKLRSLGIKIL
jgi:hypothetical protein